MFYPSNLLLKGIDLIFDLLSEFTENSRLRKVVRSFFKWKKENLQRASVSLHWGSHYAEFSISPFITESVVETSPKITICVDDPVISGYVHRHSFSDRAIFRLRNAAFSSDTGEIYFNQFSVRESQTDMSNLLFDRPPRASRKFNQPIVLAPYQTHYHWLIETLPRVIAAVQFEPNAIVVASKRLQSVQREALEMLDVEIVYSDKHYVGSNLILATYGKDSGWPHPHDLNLLRETYGVSPFIGEHKIFISRVGSRRCDSVSQEIHNYALKEGWMVVHAEKLSWMDHLSLFGQASVVAGEHGAGLANLVLAPANAELIELTKPDYANPCFAALSLALSGDPSRFRRYLREAYPQALKLSR